MNKKAVVSSLNLGQSLITEEHSVHPPQKMKERTQDQTNSGKLDDHKYLRTF